MSARKEARDRASTRARFDREATERRAAQSDARRARIGELTAERDYLAWSIEYDRPRDIHPDMPPWRDGTWAGRKLARLTAELARLEAQS